MPILASAEGRRSLKETNSRLKLWLDALSADDGRSRPAVAAPHQIADLLSELMRVGEWLRSLPNRNPPELHDEIETYRGNVERLRDLLPSIHSGLLQERARLEGERARITSIREWVRRSRETL